MREHSESQIEGDSLPIDPSEIDTALALPGVSNHQERRRVVGFLSAYRRPRVLPADWNRVRRFVLLIVAESGPPSLEWAKVSTGYVAGFVLWATLRRGAPLDREDLFYPQLIAEWVHSHYSASGRAAPNAERRLNAIAASIGYNSEGLRSGSPARDAAPYSRSELVSAHAWTQSRGTAYAREQAALAVAAAAGAGARGSEILLLQRHHFREEGGHLFIDIPGTRPRTIPVQRDWVQLLRFTLATIESPGFVYRRRARSSRRPDSTRWLRANGGPQLTRLRASRIVAICSTLPAADVTRYAGFSKLTSLAPYERFLLPPRDVGDITELLSAAPLRGGPS